MVQTIAVFHLFYKITSTHLPSISPDIFYVTALGGAISGGVESFVFMLNIEKAWTAKRTNASISPQLQIKTTLLAKGH